MSEDEKQPRRRGIYLLPNLLTTIALFFGFYAIVAASHGAFESAAGAIFIAMIMDGLDGRVARLTNTQSDFGVQYDSIADMVSFGLAPALVVYHWALADLAEVAPTLGKMGWIAAFAYAACAGLRLARFNTQAGSADKRYFQGLPSPSAAAVVAGLVWSGADWNFGGVSVGYVALVLTLAAGLLMVSNVRYYSFKEFDFRYRVPFIAMVVLVLLLAFAAIDPPRVLFAAALIYLCTGPALTVRQRRKRKAARGGGESERVAGEERDTR
ncbi:CDP-diacylglycerol--serine O-phosphatidyltransferase [Alkalilimnicola sp. S0819]|uniref:CDP-diacylglycerol--serine O-phosphatidyltransferase n=1 Tax=Alkalilimnicola sp. S0819 TaxID=2613922 RepID=UPI0012615465|nr:CDP-diacylglycerol--serine O-phosphatidyltransferase [Alkalilimnicola sp. S0819]KAB7622812.1 CDP-diacylglycerol--serine O-phosphatidyltransferase [Alkalilimnicola sp. S0819]MPQ17310.1 CDP-diacylglycerol--serine O-phosphatidyltransferase [Alkalilimnicola sp. S0819]